MKKLAWWGYKHTNGSLQVKRFFSIEDIFEAQESPFCAIIVQNILAKDRDEALKILEETLKNK